VAQASATIGGASAKFLTGPQSVAFETGAPNAASTAAVLKSNSSIKAAFGSSPVFFGMDELGGGYSSGGASASQSTVSTIQETIDLTQLTTRKDLVVGFYSGTTLGTGVTGVTLDLYADGNATPVLSESFASAAAAQAWFTNNAVDLGSLATDPQLNANTLTLTADLTVTSTSGSGFYGDLIIGDPPAAAKTASSLNRFVEAMASFGSDSGASSYTPFTGAAVHQPVPILASPAV
jgi:hypothetical protein